MPMIHLKQYVLDKQVEWGKQLSIQDISDGSGVSRDTVSRLLKPTPPRRVDEDTVLKLCKYFGVQPGQPIPFLVYDPETK